MDSTSKVINTNNIVSSDTSEINVDPKFKELYGIDGLDLDILTAAIRDSNGQTFYQSKHFVANSQITPYKQVKQAMLELEVRYHSYQEIRASLRKAEIMRKKMVKQQEETVDPLDKELIQVEIEKNDYDISIWKRKLRQSEYEINGFLAIIKEHVKTPEDVEYYKGHNEEEERQYWIARMGKQAAMDIIAFGRVGSGNMDSIAMMGQQEQLEALTVAVQYAGLINAGLTKIGVNTQEKVNNYLSKSSTDITSILENMPDENIQLTDQSKTKPETI